MKKGFLVLLSILVLIAPCFAGGTSETASSGMPKVEFANDKWSARDYNVVQGVADVVRNSYSYDLTISNYPDTASYQTVIQQSGKTSSAPGLFTWWSGSQLETLVENGIVEDISDLWTEYFIPAGVSADLADAFTFDGKVYAAPFSVLYNVIFYNKDAFEKAGITKVPETFEEFTEACNKLLAVGITPIGLKNDSWAGFIWFQQMLSVEDPELYIGVCDGSISYTDARVVKAMERWGEMLDKGYFSKPMAAIDWRKQFASGEVAMMLEPTPEIANFKNDYGLTSADDFGEFSLPSSNNKKQVIFFEAAPLCLSAFSSSKADARNLLSKWFGNDLQEYLYQNFGFANTSSINVDDPVFTEVLAHIADSDNYQLILRYYENTPEEIRNVALDEFMKFQMGNVDINTMLSTIQAKAESYWGK